MANVVDVAAYALNELGSASTMKLQKIVFYSQAYNLVKYNRPLFDEEIQAWANGPVVPALFSLHRRQFVIKKGFFSGWAKGCLSAQDASVVDHVVNRLGEKSGAELSELTHNEDPWRNARKGVPESERSNNIISNASIRDYYSSPRCNNPVFA